MWAVGTILGEMINGRPVFPGTSTMNQIERIIEVINMPSKQDIDAVGSPYAATMLGTKQLTLHDVCMYLSTSCISNSILLTIIIYHHNTSNKFIAHIAYTLTIHAITLITTTISSL